MQGKNDVLSAGKDVLASFDFMRYKAIVLKHRWYVIGFFLLVLTLGTLYTLRQPKIFASSASIEIDIQQPEILSNVQEIYRLGASGWRSEEYLRTQFSIITSRRVFEGVVEKLGLDHDLKFLGLEEIDNPEIVEEVLAKSDPIAILQSKVEVDAKPDSFLAHIKVSERDPALAALIANTIAETYIEQNLSKKLESTHSALQWLGKQATELNQELETAEKRLNGFKRDNDILTTTMEDRISITSQKLGDLNQALTSSRQTRMEHEAQWDQIKDVNPERDFPNYCAPPLMTNPLLQQLIQTHYELETNRSELLSQFTEDHPKVKALVSRMQTARSNIVAEAGRVKQSSRMQYDAALRTEKALEQELDREKGLALALHNKEVEYNQLVRSRDTTKNMYEMVVKRLKEADLTRMFNTNNIHIVDKAIVSSVPVKPRVRLNILASILLGAIGGLAIAFLIEMMDNTIKSEEEVKEITGVPMLGVVPLIAVSQTITGGSDPALISHINPKSTLAEAIRSLRTNIHLMSPDREIRTLLVTSSSPREGKTMISSSLGISLAQTGKKTLMIDADLRKPRLNKVFNLSHKIGVTTIMAGDISWQDAICDTGVPNLYMLPSGQSTPTPAELLGSESFAKLLDELKAEFHYVMLDSPPVGVVADPLILTNLADGIVLVAKFGSTTRERLNYAKNSLADVKGHLLGCVINQLDTSNRSYGYYYHRYYNKYGYSYGGYGDTGESTSSSREKTGNS